MKINAKHAEQQVLGTRIPLAALIHALAVGEHLNFRHAAVALGVSQSSVSERIRALEETLGVRLFERGHRGARLTEAGRFFLAHVADGIEQLDYAVKAAGMIGGGALGRIRIGVPTTIATGFLAELLHRYRQQWPGIETDLFDGRARDAISQVREGRLDVAFVAAITQVPDCNSRSLWTEALFIAVPDSDPRSDANGLSCSGAI
ncbi:LysR family transcriptional regulator [Stappia sp. ES.058]|uniref:LysR family transcriptional regulator n=1 Tax=Stappia sp. ES.058 TaxID=1881061 RepID=UPI00210FABA8|nr:LysR family transcriptional regulator [Stappia sp. ES.058]